MNPKVTVGIFGVLAIIAATPFILGFLNQNSTPDLDANTTMPPMPAPLPGNTAGGAVAPPPPPPPPPAPTGPVEIAPMPTVYTQPAPTVPQYKQNRTAGGAEQQAQGPALTAESLVGTVWEVGTPHGAVQVQLQQGGQATVSHPMVGAIPASWRVNGNKVNASASFMGQSINIDATIKGNTLSAPGQSIRRVR